MVGQVGILNVGAGDTKLTFDSKNPAEVRRSAAIVEDMIRRGFVLLIEVGSNEKGPMYQRAHAFDPETAEYIIAGDPPAEPEKPANVEKPSGAPRRSRQSKAAEPRRIPASSTNAVAVARTAGG